MGARAPPQIESVAQPPDHHQQDVHPDPEITFDRMLICQAITNQMTILTPDPLITQYPVLTS
jgi:PIN domain nuclease of toxin-antitoxin system